MTSLNPIRQALTELRILRPRTWASVEGLVRLTGARPADVVAALIALDSEGAIEKKKLLGLPCFRLAKVGV